MLRSAPRSYASSTIATLIAVLACATSGRAQDLDAPTKADATRAEAPTTTADADGGSDADAPPSPSAEEAAEADRKARALFKQGRIAYDDGEYRDAWDYFHQAYMLSKRPQLLYNVGQAADRLRLDQQALDAFRLYLKKLPEAENRREVENRIAALEQRLAQTGGEANAEDGSAAPADTTADAQEADADTEQGTPAPSGQPTRSGWALRGALGLGFYRDDVDGLSLDASLSSGTATVHAMLGYGLVPGLVIGAGVLLDAGLAPEGKLGMMTFDIDNASLLSGHVFLDYYLAPHDHGWHLLGGLGFANFRVSDSADMIGDRNANGGGAIVGGGVDFPFGRQWAIGVLARIVLARVEADSTTHLLISPSLAFTAVWY